MDWFLYDRNLRHEILKIKNGSSAEFATVIFVCEKRVSLKLRQQDDFRILSIKRMYRGRQCNLFSTFKRKILRIQMKEQTFLNSLKNQLKNGSQLPV